MALTIPNRFATDQTIDAPKFNSNFDAVVSWAGTTDATLATAQADIDLVEADVATLGKGAFFAYATADQGPLTATTYTTLVLDDTGTDAFDTDSYFNTSTDTYTPLVAGAYQFSINLRVVANAQFDAVGNTVKVYVTKNTTRYLVMELAGTLAHAGGASIMLKANGTTDAFKIEVYGSGTQSIDWAQFSGYCVKPD